MVTFSRGMGIKSSRGGGVVVVLGVVCVLAVAVNIAVTVDLFHLVFEHHSTFGINASVSSHKFLQVTGKFAVTSARSWTSLPLYLSREDTKGTFADICFSISIFWVSCGLLLQQNALAYFFFSLQIGLRLHSQSKWTDVSLLLENLLVCVFVWKKERNVARWMKHFFNLPDWSCDAHLGNFCSEETHLKKKIKTVSWTKLTRTENPITVEISSQMWRQNLFQAVTDQLSIFHFLFCCLHS